MVQERVHGSMQSPLMPCSPAADESARCCLAPAGTNTWSLVNRQDMIARAGKFWIYARPGGRVMVDRKGGQLLVAPGFLEAALWRRLAANASLRDHLLSGYQRVRVQRPFLLLLAPPGGTKVCSRLATLPP